jgi:hypothetical protein
MPSADTINVFYSYSREDLKLQEKFKTHLGTLRRQKIISGWDDRDLIPGENWDRVIKSKLDSADIILLLVSPDFIDSDYCYDIEVKRAVERHESGEACVIPIILRPTDWKHENVPFNKLTALPTGVEPVTKWENQDEAFLHIAQEVRKVAERIIQDRQEQIQNLSLSRAEILQRYTRKYKERHTQIKLLRMPQAINLETIYTKVRFLDDENLYRSLETMEQHHRESNQRRFQTRDRAEIDGFTVVNENPYLMVLGAPGAGKSTFLRRVGLEVLKVGVDAAAQFAHHCIPVFLELKNFKAKTVDIKQAILLELGMLGAPVPEAGVTKALEEGKFLVLLDGLDEVPKANLDAVMEAIQNFVTEYDKNRFIASCRIAAYRSSSSFQQFKDIELAEFDDEQMHQFISNWFRSELDIKNQTSDKCWSLLNLESHKAAKELGHTPLLLTFLCLVYDWTQGFPSKPAELYRRALDILLEEWAAEKRIQQEVVYEGLSTELEKIMLAEIAYGGFVQDQLFFRRQDLVAQIKAFLADTDDKPKLLDGKKVLDAIATDQGVLVERAAAVYSFSHLTIQEYLTAQYISQDPQLVENLVAKHLTDQRWREVFLLVAGSMPRNADRLLELMEMEVVKLVDTSRLQKLLAWATEVADSSVGAIKLAAKRVGALILALALALDRDLALIISCNPDSRATLRDDVRVSIYDLNSAISFARALDCAFSLAHALNLDIASVRDRNLAHNLTLIRERSRSRSFVLSGDHARDLERALRRDRNRVLEFQKTNVFDFDTFQALAEDFQKLQLEISPNISDRDLYVLRDRIFHLWRDALRLNPDFLSLIETEITALEKYFYATELIIRCRGSAVRVTESIWMGIEERILKVAK